MGLIGEPAREEELPQGWERMYSNQRDQYYFFHAASATIQWVEDHQSFPVDPFLLGDIPARGRLIHQGAGIRDSAGPEPIKAGTRVLPHEYEDDRRPRQDVAGRETSTEDGTPATFRPIPPLPKTQPGTNAPSQKVRVPISNLTKQQWIQLDDDAKALEIVWVKPASNRTKYAEEQGRALNPRAAHICLNKYFDKWKVEAPSCILKPEFGGPTPKSNNTHTNDETRPAPERQVKLLDHTPLTAKQRQHPPAADHATVHQGYTTGWDLK